ncbi:MAG: TIGR02281 family clan AA aspartic protease [Xanthobacteraceae bacterium]|nr:MAG: TIGR02281 family clan AA aspartic protease [Xanthobacteraceae bacterium]
MRAVVIVAAVLVGSGLVMARMADRAAATKPRAVAALAATPAPAPVSAGRSVTIARDGRGHFQVEGRVDGRSLGFMVDTGASVIALTESDAERLGVRPSRGDFIAPVSTANGTVKAARARLSSVDVGGLVVRDVEALVLPDNVLSENLLGLSYLARLKRFEYANGRLVLEQ